nr:hypothetical protein [Tanacetum cinerariifolium]
MSRVPYASVVGSIMYAMTCTRPDVSFALSMVSRHQQNPGEGHWTYVKNIIKYLRNTKDMFLVYVGEEELRVTGYYDASCKSKHPLLINPKLKKKKEMKVGFGGGSGVVSGGCGWCGSGSRVTSDGGGEAREGRWYNRSGRSGD